MIYILKPNVQTIFPAKIMQILWRVFILWHNLWLLYLIFFGIWIQSCTKLVGTHALLTIKKFVIKLHVCKMTCMIQYSCSSHASSPSLPHQAMLVYTWPFFIRGALSLTTLILGSGEQRFYYKMSQQFCTRLYPNAEKN